MEAPQAAVEIYNVGSTDKVSILDLAERIRRATGSTSELVFVPLAEVYGQGIEDMLHREPAIHKIRDAVGWEPTLGLDRILADVIEHARHAPLLEELERVE